jgi:hypothetical protein
MKYLFLIVILSVAQCKGQIATIKDIKQTNPLSKEKYVFPKIIIQASPYKAKKINNILRKEILDADPNTPESEIFNKVWKTSDYDMPALSNIGYEILSNRNSILSITIGAEGCGAYCESWDRYFNFNLKTGNLLTIDSLFTRTGIHQLALNLDSTKEIKIKNKLVEIQDSLKTISIQKNKDDIDYYRKMLELYTDCLDRRIIDENISSLEFVLTSSGITIYSERCSAHYNRNADELWVFIYKIAFKSWLSYLTPYARALVQR